MDFDGGIISSFVNAGGTKTHFIEAGNGDPVILIHGAGPGASAWTGWKHAIPALARHHHVYALDTLGFGFTDKPTDILYTDQASVLHLAAFIDALCLENVSLCGNSRGAYIAAKYMLDWPHKVSRLLMISSASIAAAMGVQMDRSKMRGLQTIRNYDGTREKMREFLEVIINDHAKITDEFVAERVALAAEPGHDYALKSQAQYRQALGDDPDLAQLFSIEHRLPKATKPMLMVWGGQDAFAPVEFAEQIRGQLPNVKLEIFETSGHQAQTDEVDRFNDLAIRFFAGELDAEIKAAREWGGAGST